MAYLRTLVVASAVAGAAAFAPLAAVPRVARTGATGLCMNAGTGKIKSVAAFRAGNKGRSLVPTDQDSIDLDLVSGVKDRRDTVGGVDTTYAKPGSSFFSFGARAAPKPAARAAPKPAARAAPRPAARAAPAPRAAPVPRGGARAAVKPAAKSAPAPAPAAKSGGLFSMFGGAKPAAAKPAAPAAKPLPARPAAPTRGALRGTMRITK